MPLPAPAASGFPHEQPATPPVGDDGATTACPVCGALFEPKGRQRFCSKGCRQAAWRAGRRAPAEPVIARSGTIYECPAGETRYLGEQCCDDCNTWCRRLGPGGLCPHCDEPVAISDLFTAEQLTKARATARRRT